MSNLPMERPESTEETSFFRGSSSFANTPIQRSTPKKLHIKRVSMKDVTANQKAAPSKDRKLKHKQQSQESRFFKLTRKEEPKEETDKAGILSRMKALLTASQDERAKVIKEQLAKAVYEPASTYF